MKKKLIVILLSAFVVIGGAYAVRGGKDGRQENKSADQQFKKARLAYKGDLKEIGLLLDIANDKGFAGNNGIVIEAIKAEKNVDAVLAAGEADFSISGIANPMALYLNGQDMKWLASVYYSTGYGVSRFPKEKSGLIRKAVISKLGGNPQIMAETVLKHIGVDLKKITYVTMPSDAGKKELLDKGTVDFASFVSYEFVQSAGLVDKYTVFDPGELLQNAGMEIGIIASNGIAAKDSDTVRALIKTIYETLDYLTRDRQGSIAFIADKYKQDEKAAEGFYDYIAMIRKGVAFVPGESRAEAFRQLVIDNYKPTDAQRSLGDFVDTSFAAQAAE